MTNVLGFAKTLWNDDEGATAIEYGLLAALISVAIIVAVVAVGDQLFATFDTVNTELGGTSVAAAP
jgi:pilus assembly protein Flp/PilA